MREFKSGGFHLAIEAQVPILPATVSGSFDLIPKRSLKVRERHDQGRLRHADRDERARRRGSPRAQGPRARSDRARLRRGAPGPLGRGRSSREVECHVRRRPLVSAPLGLTLGGARGTLAPLPVPGGEGRRRDGQAKGAARPRAGSGAQPGRCRLAQRRTRAAADRPRAALGARARQLRRRGCRASVSYRSRTQPASRARRIARLLVERSASAPSCAVLAAFALGVRLVTRGRLLLPRGRFWIAAWRSCCDARDARPRCSRARSGSVSGSERRLARTRRSRSSSGAAPRRAPSC